MLVHFRKRFPADVLKSMNEVIVAKAAERTVKHHDHNNPKGSCGEPDNKGKVVLDATCIPTDITYLSDLKLLNTASEKSEEIIDTLHKSRGRGHKKSRTYRNKARKAYLATAKSRRVSGNKLRKARRVQLGYLRRNLKDIDVFSQTTSLSPLSGRQCRDLMVISELYRQQQWMHDHRRLRIDDRIVSISQPHVRPIKRGKAGSDTKFGAKLSVSLAEGYAFVDCTSWDNFNECLDFQDQVKAFKRRHGVYPASAHTDRIYRTRDSFYSTENPVRYGTGFL